MTKSKKLWVNAAAVAVGAMAASLTYRYLRRYTQEVKGSYGPLIDTITHSSDGAVREVMTFGYDDDERCTWARSLRLDSTGNVASEVLIEADYYEDKILVTEGSGDADDTPTLTTMMLDRYGMVSSVSTRFPLGNEQRWDAKVNGAEMDTLTSGDTKATFKWHDGNIDKITYTDGSVVDFSYYSHVDNHLFPDLNMLSEGLSPDLITTYLLGTRSRNFVSNASFDFADGSTRHISASYLCDHFDRPVQVIHEVVTKDARGEDEKVQHIYDITYFDH